MFLNVLPIKMRMQYLLLKSIYRKPNVGSLVCLFLLYPRTNYSSDSEEIFVSCILGNWGLILLDSLGGGA